MNRIFLFSVILKGVGAVLEILMQILITRGIGLSGYGTYSVWISFADLIFWAFYSGIMKCNTFYLSDCKVSIRQFQRQFYLWYVIPTLSIAATVAVLSKQIIYLNVFAIVLLEILVLSKSSTLIARGKQIRSLTGEYVLGRLVMLSGIAVMLLTRSMSAERLVLVYILQYFVILLYFDQKQSGQVLQDISEQVSLKKWAMFQRSDMVLAMMGQLPVVLQYFLVGALEAGVVSIVLLVKKLIGFISGPTSKVFLPEFSRLYKLGKTEEIRSCFASIMHIQMLFVAPLAVALLGFPRIVLGLLARELLPYTGLFVGCAVVFLVAATVGPCSGVMLMTGHEKQDNRYRELSLVLMIGVMILLRNNRLFVLYALCSHTILETGAKYLFVCRWMKKAPVSLTEYLSWWIVPTVLIGLVYSLKFQDSMIAMIFAVVTAFLIIAVQECRRDSSLLRQFGK